jgi:hypothetical protein
MHNLFLSSVQTLFWNITLEVIAFTIQVNVSLSMELVDDRLFPTDVKESAPFRNWLSIIIFTGT